MANRSETWDSSVQKIKVVEGGRASIPSIPDTTRKYLMTNETPAVESTTTGCDLRPVYKRVLRPEHLTTSLRGPVWPRVSPTIGG